MCLEMLVLFASWAFAALLGSIATALVLRQYHSWEIAYFKKQVWNLGTEAECIRRDSERAYARIDEIEKHVLAGMETEVAGLKRRVGTLQRRLAAQQDCSFLAGEPPQVSEIAA